MVQHRPTRGRCEGRERTTVFVMALGLGHALPRRPGPRERVEQQPEGEAKPPPRLGTGDHGHAHAQEREQQQGEDVEDGANGHKAFLSWSAMRSSIPAVAWKVGMLK